MASIGRGVSKNVHSCDDSILTRQLQTWEQDQRVKIQTSVNVFDGSYRRNIKTQIHDISLPHDENGKKVSEYECQCRSHSRTSLIFNRQNLEGLEVTRTFLSKVFTVPTLALRSRCMSPTRFTLRRVDPGAEAFH